MALTNTAIRNAKPKAKPYKLTDEKGLFLLVHTLFLSAPRAPDKLGHGTENRKAPASPPPLARRPMAAGR